MVLLILHITGESFIFDIRLLSRTLFQRSQKPLPTEIEPLLYEQHVDTCRSFVLLFSPVTFYLYVFISVYVCSHQIQGRQRKFGLQIAGGIESSCRGYSTWRHVNGSPDETYPSLNHNLSCCYWLLCDSVNDAKGALHQPQRRGECHRDLDSSAQVCSLQVCLMGITPCSHNYGQIIKTRDMLQSEAFKTKHATFLCCHFNNLFIKSCLLQQLTEQLSNLSNIVLMMCNNELKVLINHKLISIIIIMSPVST